MVLRKKSILLIMVFLIGCFVCACGKEKSVVGETLVEDTEEVSSTEETKNTEEEAAVQWEKGYDLPVDEQEREEAETDCKKLMELYLDIYETADKGIASNVALDDQTVLKMQRKLKDAGCPVTTMVTYSNMENYESVDSFLKECMEGKSGSAVIYEVHNDGGLGRMKFIFDGTDMYVVSAKGIWNADNKPGISYISYTRLKEWKYTDKGWFCYELCVPEPPEVSEIVDGSCLIRIKPMTEEQREMSEKCVRGLGYQGNNLLCSNWDTEHMEELDYSTMEYLGSIDNPDEIFHAEILISGLGAIMDVAVAIAASLSEIVEKKPEVTFLELFKSGREIGYDIMGTMINVLLFVFGCGLIPMCLIRMNNDVSLITIIKLHIPCELCRFLVESIGIVLAIPISILVTSVMIKVPGMFHRQKKARKVQGEGKC